ncbi:leucine-rich repeat domain-containing protein [Flavobacterium cerinum]|uniref:Leucine-rich repeat domain-containing protein n=1 Tax=Flavobacterium cerinum TaxID=2502784 RepID=A0A444HD83_9FLAO|nr:leucine-rich repeat domain-containing protein [Flavobacterium cerinum]RWX02220.1 leucine-rich repeat domain-containing protein [Flavobacterium cerinum]
MNWNKYLSDNKAPYGALAHLGVLNGEIGGIYDLSQLPKDARNLSLSTPLKKSKLKYTNFSSLIGNDKIEAISLNDIDEARLSVFSTLPNLKYLQISNNQQTEIPDLSCLKPVEVLILASIKKVENIDFVIGMKNLKTLYIYGITNLYDITPIANLTTLEELSLNHGKMSGTGKAIKGIEPLAELTNLHYLRLSLVVENKNYNITPLVKLKKLQELHLLPRYLDKGHKELLQKELPLLKEI